jgi:hypothetical protein
VAFLWNDHGMPFRDVWTVDAEEGEPVRVTHLAPDPGELLGWGDDTSLDALSRRAERREDRGVSQVIWHPEGDELFFTRGGRLHSISADGGPSRPALESASRPAFSPDGSLLAFLREGDLWVTEVGSGVEARLTRLGAPGIWTVPIGAYLQPDAYIASYAWSPDSGSLAFEHVDQREVRRVPFPCYLHDEPFLHEVRRIYPVFRGAWSGDGREVLFIGDHEDWYRLYSIPADGGEPRRLTGDYDVAGSRGAAWITVREDEAFFVAAAHSPYERHVYRMPLAGGEPERLTRIPGIHEPSLSPDGRRLALVTSGDTAPSELYLVDVEGEGPERGVTSSPLPEFQEYEWLTPRYVSFPSRIDDFTIHARILEPPDLDPSRRYPVILGSVYSNTVQRWWNPDRPTSILQQQMAMTGDYITVLVDVRGSVGYGVDFREAFQGDWGGDDLEDLHSAVEYLTSLPYVDPDRIGIWGNSYGVHDDIVPLKTTWMMTEKLALLGRPFELEIVHNSAHWWAGSEHYARHTFRRLDDFLRRHVPPGPR